MSSSVLEIDNSSHSASSLNENEMQESKPDIRSRVKKISLVLLLVGFIAFVVIDAVTGRNLIIDLVDDFLEWVEDNPTEGVFAFIGVYMISTVLFIPGSLLTLGAGFVFSNAFGLGVGVLLGVTAVFFGASAGALISFLLGRYLFRDWAIRFAKKFPIFEAIDTALEENGLKIMSLLRLSPLIPFNALNYIGGVTAISFKDNAMALIFLLPGTTLYVFLGSSAGSLTDVSSSGDDPTATILSVVFGVVFGVLGIAATTYYAKKELKRVLSNREGDEIDEEKEATDV